MGFNVFLKSHSTFFWFQVLKCCLSQSHVQKKNGTPLFVGWNRPVYIWQECTTLNLWNQSRLEVAQRILSAFGSKKKTIHPWFFSKIPNSTIWKLGHVPLFFDELNSVDLKKESWKQVTLFLRSILYLIGMGGRSEEVNGSPNKIGEMIPLELTSFLEDSLGDVLIFSILSILSSMKLYYCALNLPPTQ